MGSRWFRYAFGSMVLFSLLMMSRFISQGGGDVDKNLSAHQLCTAFAQDYETAEDMYCDEYITIESSIDKIIGGDNPTSIIFYDNGKKEKVECFLRNNAKNKRANLYESQVVAVKGYLDEDDQKPGNYILKKSTVIYY